MKSDEPFCAYQTNLVLVREEFDINIEMNALVSYWCAYNLSSKYQYRKQLLFPETKNIMQFYIFWQNSVWPLYM